MNLRKSYSNNIISTSKNIRNKHRNQVNAIEKPQDIFEDYNTENGILQIVLQMLSAITIIHKATYHHITMDNGLRPLHTYHRMCGLTYRY